MYIFLFDSIFSFGGQNTKIIDHVCERPILYIGLSRFFVKKSDKAKIKTGNLINNVSENPRFVVTGIDKLFFIVERHKKASADQESKIDQDLAKPTISRLAGSQQVYNSRTVSRWRIFVNLIQKKMSPTIT